MRILHTSDWHIGKKTENTDRLTEQSQVLDEICMIADGEGVELVLVAGDVFDTFVPSAEAEQLFYSKIVKLAENRAVVIVSGNHDDATRLCAAAPLANGCGVYFSGNINENIISLAESGRRKICLTESGEGYAVFKNERGEELYVGLLPYPTEARFKEKSDGQTHAQKISEWMNRCMSANVNGLPQILVSHLFTAGGLTSDGEREISLGGAKAVDKNSFPKTLYTALGHLHKRQVMDSQRNIIYSGSILQYAFDEVNVEKSVTVFDIIGGAVENLHTVPLKSGKRLARISACSVLQACELLPAYKDYLVELTLKLKSPVNREESHMLHSNFPNVISVKFEISGNEIRSVTSRKNLSDAQLFSECYKKQFGEEPDKKLSDLYLSLLGEVEGQ